MNYQELVSILVQDVASGSARRQAADDQSSRRDLIRTQFAAIEGLVWLARNHISNVASELGKLSDDEAQALSERYVAIGSNGKLTSHSKFIPTLGAIKFLARLSKRICDREVIPVDKEGWNNLIEATAIRNRITHPKATEDLKIPDSDLASCEAAFIWCFEHLITAMETTNAALRDERDGIRDIFQKLEAKDPVTWGYYQAALLEGRD